MTCGGGAARGVGLGEVTGASAGEGGSAGEGAGLAVGMVPALALAKRGEAACFVDGIVPLLTLRDGEGGCGFGTLPALEFGDIEGEDEAALPPLDLREGEGGADEGGAGAHTRGKAWTEVGAEAGAKVAGASCASAFS